MLVIPKKNYVWLLSFTAIATSLIIAPYFSYDAVNPPKFLVLGTFGLAFGGLVTYKISDLLTGATKNITVASLIFLATLLMSWILAPGNNVAKFYGIYGRHTGVLTYLSLLFVFLLTVMISDLYLLKLIIRSILFTGFVSIIYAILQILELDPLPWENPSTWVQSFFGNPNFYSAFLSFSAAPIVAFLFFGEKNKRTVALSIISLFIILWILKQNQSAQGYFALILTSSVIFSIWLMKRWHSVYLKVAIVFVFTFIIIGIILDLLQKAPWISIFYKASLSTRGDYWRAAWHIFLDHPIVGVGLDQFRNYYERYRDVSAAQNIEGSLLADATHNVFLDLLVGGGIFLLLSYLALLISCFFSIVRYVNRTERISFYYISIVGIFLAYLIQSVISINHLGIAIWGWLSAGALIGFEIATRDSRESALSKVELAKKTSGKKVILKNSVLTHLVASGLGGIVGFIITVPVITSNHQLVVAYKTSDPILLYEAANKWPKDTLRMSSTAENLKNFGYDQDAYLLLQNAIKFDPESLIPWRILNEFQDLPPDIKVQVQKRIRELDPFIELTPRD